MYLFILQNNYVGYAFSYYTYYTTYKYEDFLIIFK